MIPSIIVFHLSNREEMSVKEKETYDALMRDLTHVSTAIEMFN